MELVRSPRRRPPPAVLAIVCLAASGAFAPAAASNAASAVPPGPSAVAAGLAAAVPAGGDTAGAGQKISLRYDVSSSGMFAVSFAADIDFLEDTYRIASTAKTVGVVGSLFPWEMMARSRGDLAGGAAHPVRPVRHTSDSRWMGKKRTVDLRYADDGGVTAAVDPPDVGDEREPVADDLVRESMDPISAVLSAIKSYATNPTCHGRFPVFDGRRRYDLVFSEDGGRAPVRHNLPVAADRVRACHLEMAHIAGFWRERDRRYPTEGTVWMARILDGVPAVPLKIEYEGRFGLVEIHLVELESGGEIRRFPAEPVAALVDAFNPDR